MPTIALVVDDSRTALASLGRMLAAHGVQADTAESGPEALDYLQRNAAPDVIFLDHMMPGMDGFETLAAIKADARTAGIPVVMYTSRDGEAYAGQALTQGAIGILRKPVDPTELVNLLARLERARVLARKAAGTAPPGAQAPRPRAAVTGVIDVPAELRRASTPPRPAPPPLSPAAPSARTRPRARFGVTAVALLLLAGTTGWYYQRYQTVEAQRARLQDEVERLQTLPVAEPAPRAAPATAADPAHLSLLEPLVWALNQHSQYGWNEEPFDDARLHQMRELLARLGAAGFRGSVRLESHLGEFCLVRDELGQLRLPPETLPFTRCEVVTYPPAQASLQSSRQSAEFARFVAQHTGPVRLVLAPQGNSKPLVAYPASTSVQTAGEWNQAARLNQRVEVVLVPAP